MTWLPLSREGKFHRMRDGMLYHDKPEYYNQPLFITAGVGGKCEGSVQKVRGQPLPEVLTLYRSARLVVRMLWERWCGEGGLQVAEEVSLGDGTHNQGVR